MTIKQGPLIVPAIDVKYQNLEVIVEGGMGRVFKAVHQAIGRTHALKIMRPDSATK